MKYTIILASLAIVLTSFSGLDACCGVARSGKPIVNADQTVIIIWDAAQQQQHFIRKASFAVEDQEFGFIIPSPSEPELSESGNDAFATLQKLTEPEVIKRPRPSSGISCGCGAMKEAVDARPLNVKVLQEKNVAGYKAVVLEARSSSALTTWLQENKFAYTAELAAWAQPYIDQGWKFTALRMEAKPQGDASRKLVEATALRMSFKTDRPLFPYREPAYGDMASKLNQKQRLLRIYFVADTSYHGEIGSTAWSGKPAWAGSVASPHRHKILEQLKLPAETGPAEWHLTEFEDNWPFTLAAGDVYFSRDAEPRKLTRQPIIEYTSTTIPGDATFFALVGVLLIPPLLRRWISRKTVLVQ